MSTPAPPALQVRQASLSLGGHRILDGINLCVASGERLAIVGPNGAGKSSLLHLLAAHQKPDSGQVLLHGLDLARLSGVQRARQMAVLHQAEDQTPPLALRDYVALGRIAHGGDAGDAQVQTAMRLFALQDLAHRRMSQLSGGQRRLAALARAVAQSPRVLLLDEPTNHLDLRTRVDVLDTVAALGITVVAVLHELSLVPRFAQRVLVLHRGQVAACAPPLEALTPQRVRTVFRMHAHSLAAPGQRLPLMAFDAPPGARPFDTGCNADTCP